MNDKFDELAKGLARSVTRRGALKQFGLGFAGIALGSLGLANVARADQPAYNCKCNGYAYGCDKAYPPDSQAFYDCLSYCFNDCQKNSNGHGHSHCC